MATEALAKRSSNTGPSNTLDADGYDYFWQPPAWVVTDPQNHIVEGYASLPNLDDQGDIIPLDAIDQALEPFMKWGNLREMHDKKAAGKVLAARVDEKGLYIQARVDDPIAWQKVRAGVYQGFSVGGDIPEDACEQRADGARLIKELRLNEISLVDRPANQKARISFVKLEKWTGGRTHTVMHARGIKRHKKAKCEKHKKEGCEECGCDRTVGHPGTGNSSGMASKTTGTPGTAAASRDTVGNQQLYAAKRSSKHAEKADDMKTLAKVKATLVDPEQIRKLEEAEQIVAKASGQEWHTQQDVADPASVAEEGVDLDENQGDGEDTEDFLKAKEGDGESDGKHNPDDSSDDADEGQSLGKADGGCMHHMQACHKALQACHKAFGDGDHPAKAHCSKAMTHIEHAKKCFGKEAAKASETGELAKAVGSSNTENRIAELEESVEFLAQKLANTTEYLVNKMAGLPRSRELPPETFNRDDESRAARLALNGSR
jgi:HK97 family phage prohead protease